MRATFFILTLIFSRSVLSQWNYKPFVSVDVSTGIMPLSNGWGSISGVQVGMSKKLSIFFSTGLGYSRPKKYKQANLKETYRLNENITDLYDRSHFYSFGGLVTIPLKRDAKLKMVAGTGLVIGYGKEEAHHHFFGADFGNYTSDSNYRQEYKFIFLLFRGGLNYKLSSKCKLELSANIPLIGDKDVLGKTWFYTGKVYSFSSFGGLNLSIAWQIWKNKNIKEKGLR